MSNIEQKMCGCTAERMMQIYQKELLDIGKLRGEANRRQRELDAMQMPTFLQWQKEVAYKIQGEQ
jgi:hypothetical protein